MVSEQGFSIIETLLWENGGYFLMDLHLERLENSARHFSFTCDVHDIEKALYKAAETFTSLEKYRVRLLLNNDGETDITFGILPEASDKEPVKAVFSSIKTDRNDPFLYHKTTNRNLYDTELAKYRKDGFFDVLFMNQDQEVTEGAITNVLIQKGDVYLTPPLSCGLLNGVYRQHLLRSGEITLQEKVLFKDDLLTADKIFLINSVRKLRQITLL